MAEPPYNSKRPQQHQHHNQHHLKQYPDRHQQYPQRHEQQLPSRPLQHQPILKGSHKRKLVWTREEAGAAAVASTSGDTPAGVHVQPQPVRLSPAASGAAGRVTNGRPADQRQKAVQLDALEALRAKVAAKEAQVQQARARAAVGAGGAAGALEAEVQQRNERRQKLEAGFAAALAEAARLGVGAAAAGAPVQPADAAQVTRVLQAKTDYEVLQIVPGASAAAIRKRYRDLAVCLHPDKCTAPDATLAFQRLVAAFSTLNKHAI